MQSWRVPAGRETRGLASAERPKFEHEAYVKRFSSGIFCVCLLLFRSLPVHAQQPEPVQGPTQGPAPPQRPEPPPLPPQPPDVKLGDEGKLSLDPFLWFPHGEPTFDKGKGTTSKEASRLTLPGKSKYARGLRLSIPAGGHNALRLSYFDNRVGGTVTAPTDLNLWSVGYNVHEQIATQYTLRNFKLSYEYLTWPYPVRMHRVRLKTLWQVQYVQIKSTFNTTNPDGSLNTGTGSKSIILPTLGLGITDYFTDNFRIDLNASGFTIPHRSAIGDVDGALAYKISHVELRGGLKFFYYKNSPNADFFMRGRLLGGFVGLRLYWN